MKKATVADLRNHFRKISAWIENGESVEIIKRGRPFARLAPARAEASPAKVDFGAQMRRVWHGRVFSDSQMRSAREAELGIGA